MDLSNEGLTSEMYEAWRFGVFRGFTDRALGHGKANDCCLVEGRLVSKLAGVEQLLWFNGEGETRFNVFTNLPDSVMHNHINDSVSIRNAELTPKRRKIYEEIFGAHNVTNENIDYNRSTHFGVLVRVAVKDLPRGRGGALSQKLFSYAYNMFVLPALANAWGNDVRGRDWYVFDRPQNVGHLR